MTQSLPVRFAQHMAQAALKEPAAVRSMSYAARRVYSLGAAMPGQGGRPYAPTAGLVCGGKRRDHGRQATIAPRRRGRTRAAQPAVAAPSPPAAPSGDPYILRGLLVCGGCGRRLCPLETVGGGRAYRSPCGCRLHPVDAEAVEQRTVEAAMRRARRRMVPGATAAGFALVRDVLIAVRVGATPEDLSFVPRVTRTAASQQTGDRARRPTARRPVAGVGPGAQR